MWNVPVTVNSTRKTYKNVFCALCNGVAVQDGVIWETILRCLSLPFQYERSYLSELNISSVNDIPDKVPEMFCNVLFQTPILPGTNTRIQGTKQCSGVIDRCNVTGQWKGEPFPYDYHMESACLSYKSEYKGYRNIHCYLCNGGNTSGIETECYPSFSAFSTRDFTLVVRNPISKDNQTCNSDCVFDSSTNTCRRLHCSRGFVFDDRQCVPFLQPDTAVSYYYVYDVMLTFEPDTSSLTKAVTTWWIQSLITKTTSDVNIKLRRPGETDYFSTCDVRSYIKYKHTINELSDTLKREVREILFFDVMYFAVSFRISITNITNMFKKIGELEALYNFTNVEIYGHLMKGRSRTIDPVLLGKVNGHDEIARLNRSVGEPMVDSDLVKSLGLETYMEDTLLNSVTDDSDGLAMSTLPYNYNTNNDRNNLICDSIAVINKDVFCPKIELKSGEFSLDRDRLRIKSLGRYISKDIGHFDSGWATVLICNHTYMDLVSRGPVSGGRLVRVSLEIMFSTIFVIFWPDISVI